MPRALLTHPETPCRALKFRAMATREHVHKLVDELPDAALGPVAEFIAARGGAVPAKSLTSGETSTRCSTGRPTI